MLHFVLLTRSQKIKKLLRVTNSIVELFLFHFRVTNSKLKYKVALRVTNSMVNFCFFGFKLLTRSWKIKISLRVTNSMGANFVFSLPIYEKVRLINEKNYLIIAVSKRWTASFYYVFSFNLLCCQYIYDIYLSMLDFNGLWNFNSNY